VRIARLFDGECATGTVVVTLLVVGSVCTEGFHQLHNYARAHNLRLAEVAEALAKGATNRDAGAALTMSARTVEAHLGHICQKLGVRFRNQLARCVMAAEGHPAIPEETKWP
jgi:DNA-binding CsgD family transcriptional regulator